jgi:hypothetical protein
MRSILLPFCALTMLSLCAAEADKKQIRLNVQIYETPEAVTVTAAGIDSGKVAKDKNIVTSHPNRYSF